LRYVWLLVAVCGMLAAESLQALLQRVPAGSMVELPAGRFEGPIVIDKPLILKGVGHDTVIAGDGNGTVITVRAPHVRIENLHITHGGDQRYRLDAGIRIDGGYDIAVRGCRFDSVLFGVVAFDTRDLRITNNRIASYPDKVVDNRGDGIRVWQVRHVRIARNRLIGGRDLSVNRAEDVNVTDNEVRHGRYGVLAFMSERVRVAGNHISDTYAGILSKMNRDIVIENNRVFKSRTATGTGILLEKGRRMIVRHNDLTAHAQAIYVDSLPTETGIQRVIEENRIINNTTAFHFHAAIKGNRIVRNDIAGNLIDVQLDIRPNQGYDNEIARNYWDRYEGFDRNGDGIGDTPYIVRLYADKLWQFDHHLRFFFATPVLALIDLMERLAPFSEPVELLRDPSPPFERVFNSNPPHQRDSLYLDIPAAGFDEKALDGIV